MPRNCALSSRHLENFNITNLSIYLKQSPDFAHEVMEDIFRDMSKDIEVYIDDIGIFANSEEHTCSNCKKRC
jgi:uncharacterized protein YeeX (DUF496 family)